MTNIHYLNLIAAILIVATLACVCRIAFLLAGGRFDRRGLWHGHMFQTGRSSGHRSSREPLERRLVPAG